MKTTIINKLHVGPRKNDKSSNY